MVPDTIDDIVADIGQEEKEEGKVNVNDALVFLQPTGGWGGAEHKNFKSLIKCSPHNSNHVIMRFPHFL